MRWLQIPWPGLECMRNSCSCWIGHRPTLEANGYGHPADQQGGWEGEGCRSFASLSLQPIISNSGCSGQRLLQITRLQPKTLLIRDMPPKTSEAIGLQLLSHRQFVYLGFATSAPRCAHLFTDTQQCLHMMTHLMRNNIGLRKIAGGPVTHRKVMKEREIDIKLFVGGTIKWPDRRGGHATGRRYAATE